MFAFTTPGEFAGNGGFVTKLNATGTAVVYTKNIAPEAPTGPGQQQTHATGVFSVAVDAAGSAYVTGATNSPVLVTTAGAYQPAFNSPDIGLNTLMDGFVVKLDAAGHGHLFHIPGHCRRRTRGMASRSTGRATRMSAGRTSSSSFPVTAGAYQTTYGGGAFDVFVTKLNRCGLGAGLFRRVSETPPATPRRSIALDCFAAAYVAGDTRIEQLPHDHGRAASALRRRIIRRVRGAPEPRRIPPLVLDVLRRQPGADVGAGSRRRPGRWRLHDRVDTGRFDGYRRLHPEADALQRRDGRKTGP